MDNLREKRELYNGFGNALSRAFELVVTPLIFGLGGHLLDGALGTGPARQEFWLDAAGRLLRVSIPSRDLVATRDDLPR